jgi:glucose/arabinose dehydrogenase
MRSRHAGPLLLFVVLVALSGCKEEAKLPVAAGYGTNPQLPSPHESLIPTVQIAPAKGWPEGGTPVAGSGLKVAAYASGLDHPRWLYVLPNGDMLVAETNAPERPDDSKGFKGWVYKKLLARAGSKGMSADRITLLRDADGDGTAETRTIFLQNLNSPFGMALVGNDFYVANTDAIVRFPYAAGTTRITTPGVKVADLPAGTLNHHWTKNILASADGSHLYATVGSNSNAAENGIDAEKGRAAILEVDLATGKSRIYASGLRNPNGLGLEPVTGVLWTAVNERDELGGDVPPDYLTSVKDGGFYGFPYCYWGRHVDTRVKPQRNDLVAAAIVPDYGLGPHTASLGLAFSRTGNLPTAYTEGAFVGQHGSWNRDPVSGYKVIFVPFKDSRPSGKPVDVLTGFLTPDGNAMGRPVGVALDSTGALLVADDVGNKVWRVTAATPAPAPSPEERP